jgi:UDP-N-acetylmuramoyl-tripeptide--D-alanyl-D-alanine ligase
MTEYLWKTTDMIAAMAGRPIGSMPQGITGISIDSRDLKGGEAFFAIKGDRVDGHDFANVAAANGAALLVVSEAKLPALGRITTPLIVVSDVLEAMEKLGHAARQRTSAKIIAVTGSVGKTTTKEMLRQVLSACGSVHYSPASFNNHWGVPLTLARLPENADFGVFEIGMNHPDEIRPLVKMVEPHIAIITTIAAAHLGNFRNIEEIAAAKAEIFEGVVADGHVLLNRDNSQFDYLETVATACRIANIHSFGVSAKADFRLVDYQSDGDSATFWAVIGGRTVEVNLKAPGKHIAENALAVLAASYLAGADLDTVVAAFSDVAAAKGRGQRNHLRIADGTFTLIDESYNANPAPCGRQSHFSKQRGRVRAGAGSPSSATCLKWASTRRKFMPGSRHPCKTPASPTSGSRARIWPICAMRLAMRRRQCIGRQQMSLQPIYLRISGRATC